MAYTDALAAERAALRKSVVARFNEDGRPLTRQALDVLVAHLLTLPQDARAGCVAHIFAKLEFGAARACSWRRGGAFAHGGACAGAELTVDAERLEAALGNVTEPKDAVDLVQVRRTPDVNALVR